MSAGQGALPFWAIAVLIPVAFVGLWSAIIYVLSYIGGWRRVAAVYPARERPAGAAFRPAAAYFGQARYKNVLDVVVADEGLYLAMPWIFSIGHAPLMIPWSAVRRPRKVTSFWRDLVEFEVGEPRLARVRLPADVLAGTPLGVG